MTWASAYIERLRAGETVSFRPRGNSMTPRIRSGQLCTVVPLGAHQLKKGDVVLCKVRGRHLLHLVQSVREKLNWQRVQIGNNHGCTNGTIGRDAIYGVLVKVED